MESLTFTKHPIVTLATNEFVNVPIILQFEDTPLISIIREEKLGYSSEIPIFHSDGTKLAKVRGTRVYPTEEGKNAGVAIDKHADRWVCSMQAQILFEIKQGSGDAFKMHAELYSPNGYLVKVTDSPSPVILDSGGASLKVGGVIMSQCKFSGVRIGVLVKRDGSVAIGCR